VSKCAKVSPFAQPARRHRWSAIAYTPVTRAGIFRYCLNLCGAEQCDNEIPASARRQFELERSTE
jgi:hypothetical protein